MSNLHTMQSCSGTYLALPDVCEHVIWRVTEQTRIPSQISLEFRSICVGGDRYANLDVVCGAENRVRKPKGAAIEFKAPSQFKLALRFDQIFNTRVGVRLDYSLNPNEGAHGS